jgi:hypothetical protein
MGFALVVSGFVGARRCASLFVLQFTGYTVVYLILSLRIAAG